MMLRIRGATATSSTTGSPQIVIMSSKTHNFQYSLSDEMRDLLVFETNQIEAQYKKSRQKNIHELHIPLQSIVEIYLKLQMICCITLCYNEL